MYVKDIFSYYPIQVLKFWSNADVNQWLDGYISVWTVILTGDDLGLPGPRERRREEGVRRRRDEEEEDQQRGGERRAG